MSKLSDFRAGRLNTIDVTEVGEASLIKEIYTSGEFTVPFSGYYCILATGGSASANTQTAPPGDTIVSVGGGEVFRSKGAKFISRINPLPDSFAEINREYKISSTFDVNPQKVAFAVLEAGTPSEKIDEGYVFGIPGFVVEGGYYEYGTGNVPYNGTSKISSSVVLYLQEGAEIVFSIGTGGQGRGNGASGKIQIYSLEGINVL